MASVFALRACGRTMPRAPVAARQWRASSGVATFDSRQTPRDEAEAREELAKGYRIGHRMDLADLVWGHMSLRIPETEHFLTIDFPNAWENATSTNLVKVDILGNIISDPSGRCTRARLHPAWNLHAAVHRQRPDAKCIVHSHSDEALTFIGLGQRELLPINQEAMVFNKRVSYHEYSTEPYMSGVVPPVARSIGPVNNAMFLEAHGLMTLGATVGEALVRMKALNQSIKSQLMAMDTGRELKPQPDDIAEFFAEYIYEGWDHGRYEWETLTEEDNRLRPASSWTDVLDFWFSAGDMPNPRLWFDGELHRDNHVRQRFGGLLMQALSGSLASWEELGCEQAVATILVLDQFPRMAFRGQPGAGVGDATALAISKRLLSNKAAYAQMQPLHRFFATFPLQRSADAADQAAAVMHMKELRETTVGTKLEEFFAECVQHAEAHQAVVNHLHLFPRQYAAPLEEKAAEKLAAPVMREEKDYVIFNQG